MLTTAEINAATGRTFSDGAINEQVTQENLVACDWHGDTGIDTVQVLISTVGAYDSYRQTAIDVFGDAPDATVPGTVRAFMMPDGSLIGMDLGNGVFLQVSYVSVNADPRAAIQELAPKAAGRMT